MSFDKLLKKMQWTKKEALKRINSMHKNDVSEKDFKDEDNEYINEFFNTDKKDN